MAKHPQLIHAFSGRQGGVSRGRFSSLNLGLHVEDTPEAPLENRRRLGEALGIDACQFVCPQQVHGARVHPATGRDTGKGALEAETAIPGTDALWTTETGVPLVLVYADCLPIILFDPQRPAIAVVHAGWRGTAAGIAAAAVNALVGSGSEPKTLLAALGPAIQLCCFQS